MIAEIKIPSAGESITEVAIGSWLAEEGSYVEKDQEIAEVESDKATLPLIAPASGKLHILAALGQKVQVGDLACTIDTSVNPPVKSKTIRTPVLKQPETKSAAAPPVDAPEKAGDYAAVKATPLARTLMEAHHLDVEDVIKGLKKLTRTDVERFIDHVKTQVTGIHAFSEERKVESTPMSPLRRKLSKRLVAVKNETAMLTTFNEVDMHAVLGLRNKYKQAFQERHGVKLGLMSFFTRACAKALMDYPRVNAMTDGENILSPGYVDIAIAVQTEKGLMVPVIRNAHLLNIANIELTIGMLAQKARDAKLSVEEMTGGTFTITNGGVFGSMLSTPILNPPQSAILGMHNIVERPVALNGRVEIRPIMYVALSYDHRIIDGRDSVGFLVKVKEYIESPVNLAFEGGDPEKFLLGL
jgi:2-oxoglutarate dehydrogenase E2 component (dihydrolipoamide succinyltransferase)